MTSPFTARGLLRRHRRWVFPLAALALSAQMAVAMATAAVRQTPTIDEPVYVAAGVAYVQRHDLTLNPEHPPLGKLLIGAGPTLGHVRSGPHGSGSHGSGSHGSSSHGSGSWEGSTARGAGPETGPAAGQTAGQTAGRRLLYESGHDPWRIMLLARLPVIMMTLLFGLVVLAFATDLAGRAAGLVALGLYGFSPDVIAHGSLATLDVAAAGFLLTSAWLLWRARHGPLHRLPLAAVALGAAMATKMSVLPAVPVMLGLAAFAAARAPAGVHREGAHGRLARRVTAARWPLRGAAVACTMAVISVGVVWAVYLTVDPRLRWAAPPPGTPAIHGLRGLLVDLLPFPPPYRDGLRIQLGLERSAYTGFLFGRRYTGGLWYYLPAALLVKTPLGMLALWAAGVFALVRVPRLRPAAPYVLLPAAVLLAAAMTGARNFGVRYVLVVPVFLAIAAACTLVLRWRPAPFVAALSLAYVGISSLRAFPYYLPYSNEAYGGPPNTRLHLHDSNADWGQDLGRLADRLRERHPGERIWLVYKGSGAPSAYGITASDPLAVPAERVRGLLVVSASAVAKAGGRLATLIEGADPVEVVGHSIVIYRREPAAGTGPKAWSRG